MVDIISAYIAGCKREELDVLAKEVIKRQDVLRNSEELRLEELRRGIVSKM
jgi:hypothetical protein